jgi:DNA-binding ferritin-like protein
MQNLLVHTRAMNLITHHFHNVCSRVAFLSDHEFFGEVYEALDDAYDAVAERLIGLQDSSSVPLMQVLDASNMKLKQLPQDYKDNAQMFQILLQLESEMRAIIEEYIKSGEYSQGTVNMLAQLADDSEMRTYKIKRRLVK